MLHVLLVLITLWLTACDRLENSLNAAKLQCGEDVAGFADARFILPSGPTPLDPKGWQGIAETKDGYRPLARSSRGCLVVPLASSGAVYVRHATSTYGARLDTEAWSPAGVQKWQAVSGGAGMRAETLSLSCGKELNNSFNVPYGLQRQPSSQLRHYVLNYELFAHDDSALSHPISHGHQDLSADTEAAARVTIPMILLDGSYRMRFQLRDVFEDLFATVSSEAMECAYTIDTQYPLVAGLANNLSLLESNAVQYRKVGPGQAVSIDVTDSSTLQTYICLYEVGSTPCTNFTALSGPLNAPNQGAWIVRTYAEDAAGNRSTILDLPPLAVIHDDVMNNVSLLLTQARNLKLNGKIQDANLTLLKAFRAYYSLTLPLERQPLSAEFGLAYSEVTRSQHYIADWQDHREQIRQLEWNVEGVEKSIASLDAKDALVIRSVSGRELFRASGVLAIAPSSRFGLLILYRDGRLQQGFRQAPAQLPGLTAPLNMRFDDSRQLLAVSDKHDLALFNLLRDNPLVWRQPFSGEAEELELGIDLVLTARKNGVDSWSLASGEAISSQNWDRRCSFSLGQPTDGRTWFIGLVTDTKYRPDGPGEEFHCLLQSWDGRGPLQIVNPLELLNKDDVVYKPESYLFEEITTLSYDAHHQWLVFGRNLDSTFVIYDLKAQAPRVAAQVFEASWQGPNPQSQISSIRFSADGRYLSVGEAGLDLVKVWDTRGVQNLEAMVQLPVLSTIIGNGRRITSMLLDSDLHWLVFADENRQVRISNFIETLLPEFDSKLLPSFTGAAPATLLVLQGDRIERRSIYGQLEQSIELPQPELAAMQATGDGRILALDRLGRLWEYAEAWQEVAASGLTFPADAGDPLFTISPTGNRVIIADRRGETSILTRSAPGVWTVSAKLDFASTRAAFSPDEQRISLQSNDASGLWTLDGQALVQVSGSSLDSSDMTYRPFSRDGSRWLTRLSKTSLQVWDVANARPISAAISWPTTIAFVSFAADAEHLWIATDSRGRGQAVREIDLSGRETRDYGDFDGSIRYLFEQAGELRAFDSIGRLFALSAKAPNQTILLIGTGADPIGEPLLDAATNSSFLLTQPQGSQRLGVLYLQEDRRQLLQLCSWLSPLLTAGEAPEFATYRQDCAAARRAAVPAP